MIIKKYVSFQQQLSVGNGSANCRRPNVVAVKVLQIAEGPKLSPRRFCKLQKAQSPKPLLRMFRNIIKTNAGK